MYSGRERYDSVRRVWAPQNLTSSAGNLRQLNELAKNAKADYIIHTGDFGFYDDASLDRIAEKWVK